MQYSYGIKVYRGGMYNWGYYGKIYGGGLMVDR